MMRRGLVFFGVALVLLLAAIGWSRWRGAEVQVLELRLQPLQQWVVASGQVRNQSLARIGAEITGTVIQRHVREGDEVQAGDLLISLRRDELQAQYEQAQTALRQLRNSSTRRLDRVYRRPGWPGSRPCVRPSGVANCLNRA